jgi:Histidine kinase
MKIDTALLRASWHAWLSTDAPRAGPGWWQWGWSIAWAFGLAVLFTLVGALVFARGPITPGSLAQWYGRNLVVCLTISLLIHAMFALAQPWAKARMARWASWQHTVFFSGIPLLGVAVGWPLGVSLAGGDLGQWLLGPNGWRVASGSVLLSLAITFALHHYFGSRAREIEARRAATEAQLRLLQAQIEPHFLFNTLANVQSLIDHDAPRARHMLCAFTEYLRASLGGLRREAAPLADEIALAEAYLRVQQTRMDDRLSYRIDASEAARRTLLPPLLLQPLVENAVHHGLEPQIEGGTVRLKADIIDGRLVVDVIDDGRGLEGPRRKGGNGLALSNIRERLNTRFGSLASLDLSATADGTRARLTLPLPDTAPAA